MGYAVGINSRRNRCGLKPCLLEEEFFVHFSLEGAGHENIVSSLLSLWVAIFN